MQIKFVCHEVFEHMLIMMLTYKIYAKLGFDQDFVVHS